MEALLATTSLAKSEMYAPLYPSSGMGRPKAAASTDAPNKSIWFPRSLI